MSDGSMEKFLDSYDKVESDPECLKVQHVGGQTRKCHQEQLGRSG